MTISSPIFCYLDIYCKKTDIFRNMEKYNLHHGQIHFAFWNAIMVAEQTNFFLSPASLTATRWLLWSFCSAHYGKCTEINTEIQFLNTEIQFLNTEILFRNSSFIKYRKCTVSKYRNTFEESVLKCLLPVWQVKFNWVWSILWGNIRFA